MLYLITLFVISVITAIFIIVIIGQMVLRILNYDTRYHIYTKDYIEKYKPDIVISIEAKND